MEICGVNISHPDKILYQDAKISKEDIAHYYASISAYMLPHLKDRPLSLKQYPEGIEHTGFFHKHAASFYPDYLPIYTLDAHKTSDKMQMVGAKTAKDLVYLAGQNAIEFHTPTSKAKNSHKPDQIILDFDPSDDDFEKVRTLALITIDILQEKNLQCFVKTTGNRGVHLHIPIKPTKTYEVIKPIAKEISEYIEKQQPDLATTQLRKNKRDNKVFIDYLRNDFAMTAVAPYSLRANKIAGIATPISYAELKNNKINAQSFTIKNIAKRMQNFNDPWLDF